MNKNIAMRSVKKSTVAVGVLLLIKTNRLLAQNGNTGINEASQKVRSFFYSGTNLTYAVGAVKVAAAWFGSCVFLVIVATLIKSFFGVYIQNTVNQ